MANSPVSLSPEEHQRLRAWADAQPPPVQDGRLSGKSKDQVHEERNARQAKLMRKRRKDPKVIARQKLAQNARDTAYRRLVAAFPDDFKRLHNAERASRGLPPVEATHSRRPRTVTVASLPATGQDRDLAAVAGAPVAHVAKIKREAEAKGIDCKGKHPEIMKLAYGKFCSRCGQEIK